MKEEESPDDRSDDDTCDHEWESIPTTWVFKMDRPEPNNSVYDFKQKFLKRARAPDHLYFHGQKANI